MKKYRLKKNVKIVLCLIIIAIIVIVLLFIPKNKDLLLGSWVTDGGTVYTFEKDGIGSMNVTTFKYEFTYTKDETKISIDFKDDKVIDNVYTYTLEDNKLTISGDRGKFVLTKKEEDKK